MRRGFVHMAFRQTCRALRHGLVVAGVCVAIALVTGVSGFAFGERADAAHSQALPIPTRDSASTSREVLRHWLKPLAKTDEVGGNAAFSAPAAAVAVPLQVVTVDSLAAEPPATASADEGDDRVTAQRFGSRAVPLRPGDRAMVSVSFYYCEESPGGYTRGDGGGFCGIVRDGSTVRSGVAACDVAYLGQRFQVEGDPTGRVYVCADTGSAVHGLHRDIWFMSNRDGWNWQRSVGEHAFIRILP